MNNNNDNNNININDNNNNNNNNINDNINNNNNKINNISIFSIDSINNSGGCGVLLQYSTVLQKLVHGDIPQQAQHPLLGLPSRLRLCTDGLSAVNAVGMDLRVT